MLFGIYTNTKEPMKCQLTVELKLYLDLCYNDQIWSQYTHFKFIYTVLNELKSTWIYFTIC